MNRTDMTDPGFRHLPLWLLMLLSLALPAAAQQLRVPQASQLETEAEAVPRYAVEIIVFQYAGNAAATTELFEPEEPLAPEPVEYGPLADEAAGDLDPDIPAYGDDVDAGSADGMVQPDESDDMTDSSPADTLPPETLDLLPTLESAGITILPPEDYTLNDAYARLEKIDAYQPLLHAAWIQPTLAKEVSRPLTLRRIGDPPLRLEGTLTLYLSRFLHLVVDLSLEEKQPVRPVGDRGTTRFFSDRRGMPGARFGVEPVFARPPIFYRIEEDRIVRNGELRYFDHPKFGMLAKVTRIEEPVDDGDDTGDLLPGG